MKRIHKTALVPYSTPHMFELVNDIESYPQFLPWCKSAQILERNEAQIKASIMMGGTGLHKSFTTYNIIKPNEWIEMRLVEGPFSHLQGFWNFHPLGDKGCKISLNLEFEISNRLLRMSLEPIFTQIANNLVDAFVQRAHQCYGTTP